jgi:hypothetical protein
MDLNRKRGFESLSEVSHIRINTREYSGFTQYSKYRTFLEESTYPWNLKKKKLFFLFT